MLKLLLNHHNIKTTERYINLLTLDIKEELLQHKPLDNLQDKSKGIKLKLENRK